MSCSEIKYRHSIRPEDTGERLRIYLRGAVQGTGFRPFVFRLAGTLGLSGWVRNSNQGVTVEVEGSKDRLDEFLLRLDREKPTPSRIYSLEPAFLDAKGYRGFSIQDSDAAEEKTVFILPDIATCEMCLKEIQDPRNRRYRYPFTNCTHCGPRYSILENLPYDRPHTTMKKFTLCKQCQAEYDDPENRRFHAQPNACPDCGPRLELWDRKGKCVKTAGDALDECVRLLGSGRIVAIKGVGGFHLMVSAACEEGVGRLRRLKRHSPKPFALMYPDLGRVRHDCETGDFEERLLASPEAPILLLRRRRPFQDTGISEQVAPGNPYLGIMLPSNPLHFLLMRAFGAPVVATSGNHADETLVTDEQEALERLSRYAEYFLVHDRPIANHVDDSIVQVVAGREMVLRRSRGYAPLPVRLGQALPEMVAVGAQLKDTIAYARKDFVFVSQHIGDLDTLDSCRAFEKVMGGMKRIYDFKPTHIVADLHPAYRSTQFANTSGIPKLSVQHHVAHVLACMAENEMEGPALGVAWDGTGYGTDGTIWGGEFFQVGTKEVKRIATFRQFPLLGGDQAIREPRRQALALLYTIWGEDALDREDIPWLKVFTKTELEHFKQLLKKGVRSPLTSSAGRLFDAVSSLLNLCHRTRFEGEAAMAVEFLCHQEYTTESYPVEFMEQKDFPPLWIFNWEPMIRAIVEEQSWGVAPHRIAAKFHNTLAEVVAEVAFRAGQPKVALSGGCFQNRYLTARTVAVLRERGFNPYWHQRIPPNDGGIALGQLAGAERELRNVSGNTR